MNFLVPEIDKIFASVYYWGIMDRYEAEKLLENKPEGSSFFINIVNFSRNAVCLWKNSSKIDPWTGTLITQILIPSKTLIRS